MEYGHMWHACGHSRLSVLFFLLGMSNIAKTKRPSRDRQVDTDK